jgi:hypothetical protein
MNKRRENDALQILAGYHALYGVSAMLRRSCVPFAKGRIGC